jgi:hypothetical protein
MINKRKKFALMYTGGLNFNTVWRLQHDKATQEISFHARLPYTENVRFWKITVDV